MIQNSKLYPSILHVSAFNKLVCKSRLYVHLLLTSIILCSDLIRLFSFNSPILCILVDQKMNAKYLIIPKCNECANVVELKTVKYVLADSVCWCHNCKEYVRVSDGGQAYHKLV